LNEADSRHDERAVNGESASNQIVCAWLKARIRLACLAVVGSGYRSGMVIWT